MADYEFKSYVKQWQQCAVEATDETLVEAAADITRDAMIAAPIFVGNLRRSIAFAKPRTEGQQRVIDIGFAGGNRDAFRYAMSVEKGRRPGRRPPIDALKPWVEMKWGAGRTWKGKAGGAMYARASSRRSSAASRDSEITSKAFLLARHIGEHGTAPKPFLVPAFDKHAPHVKEHFTQNYQRRVAALVPRP